MSFELPLTGRVALSPRATLEGYFAAQPGPFGRVTPDTSYPLSLFVPPAKLGPLQFLADKLRTGWRCMVNAALSRERLPDPAAALEQLDALCRELVREHPAIGRVVRAGGAPVRLEPPLIRPVESRIDGVRAVGAPVRLEPIAPAAGRRRVLPARPARVVRRSRSRAADAVADPDLAARRAGSG